MYNSYKTLVAATPLDLDQMVNAALADGFVPIGGVECGEGEPARLYQAVAKPILMTAMMLNSAIVPGKKEKKKKKKDKKKDKPA